MRLRSSRETERRDEQRRRLTHLQDANMAKNCPVLYSARKRAALSEQVLSAIAEADSAYLPATDDVHSAWTEAFGRWREFRNKSSDESVQRNTKNPLLV